MSGLALLSAYGLYPLIELLERAVLRFDREESPPQKLHKLEGCVRHYGLPLAEVVPSWPRSSPCRCRPAYAPVSMSPEQQKQHTLHALLTAPLTHGRAAAAPPGHGRPALGRSLDPRVAQSPGGSGPNHPHPGLVHVSAGLQRAVDGAGASDPGDVSPLAPGPDHAPDAAGGARQGAPRPWWRRSWPRPMGCRCLWRR